MDNEYFRKILSTIILIALLVLSYLLIKPILLAIFLGILLAFIFNPLYKLIFRGIKSQTFSALFCCLLLLAIILLPVWFFTPMVIKQSFSVYESIQEIDFAGSLRSIFPNLFSSDEFSHKVGTSISTFIEQSMSHLISGGSDLIFNFASYALQFVVVLFMFFFVLRDKELIVSYMQSLLPFSKEVEKKLFDSTKDITISVLYGQLIIGILQGLIVGAGFLIFGVNNAILLTILAILAGLIPMVGTAIIWIPTALFLFLSGNASAAWGIILFGVFAGTIDNVIRPFLFAKRSTLHPLLTLIGMIGGLFLFGILGLILGPLVLAYLFIIVELYRDKRLAGVFIQPPEETKK